MSLPAGLVAAYSFNETAGTSANDASGNGNTGSIAGATRTAAGKYGGALSFNGVSDRVNINDSASLDLTAGMTIEAWVRPSSLSGWRTVILKEKPGDFAYALYASNGSRPGGYTRTGGLDAAVGTAALALDAWTHLAATYDGAFLRLYVNGAQVTAVAASGSIDVSTSPLRIGGNAVWGSEYFAGLIDEVRVYNRALSAAEIMKDMETPLP